MMQCWMLSEPTHPLGAVARTRIVGLLTPLLWLLAVLLGMLAVLLGMLIGLLRTEVLRSSVALVICCGAVSVCKYE
jgi:hypothetical protein